MIGVVADDITGSNDIGSMFAKNNYLTHIYPYQKRGDFKQVEKGDPRVTILDTDSRFDSYDIAYNKVYKATLELKEAGIKRFYNKTCSVFRGNIGAEFDAMLDALEEDFAIVVVGFPKNGRKTIDGIHYVHGRKLSESEFKNDPMHPMSCSNLIEILQSQTDRKVKHVNYRFVKKGPSRLREKVEKMKNNCNYLIFDVTSQEDLSIIARATSKYRVFCGSSALAEELPVVWGKRGSKQKKIGMDINGNRGILAAAGSLMPQTAAQIEYLGEKGFPVFELNTLKLFDTDSRNRLISKLVEKISDNIISGKDVVFHSSNQPEKVELTREKGLGRGLSRKDVSRLVSGTIAEIITEVVEKTDQNRLLIAGGDTSAVVCNKLGIKGLRVYKEIKPGLPSCISLTDPPFMLVLKSGSFGENNFFELAINHLKLSAS